MLSVHKTRYLCARMLARNVSLLPFNTFGLEASTAHFATFADVATLQQLLPHAPRPILVLGGGSNVLLTQNWPGTVLKNEIKGIQAVQETDQQVWLRVGAGEVWHHLVEYAVAHNYGGLENLSLIPGSVGASPIQNIGAYGVEIKDVFAELEAIDLLTGETRLFTKSACAFGYRDSVFKHDAKGRYAIAYVTFCLQKPPHTLHLGYGDVQKTLEAMGVSEAPTIADVSRAVVAIRRSKLPDPTELGNCGSFFKNPEISAAQAARFLAANPNAPHYPLPDGRIKVPAGWLIEQCGWKGVRIGNTGSHEKQALVLVNYGAATGREVLELAENIIESVAHRFHISLEPEVNLLHTLYQQYAHS